LEFLPEALMTELTQAGAQPSVDRDRAADQVFGVWTEAMAELVSYRYFGTQSVLVDRHHATGTMPMRPDMRASGGMLLAPLAIGMLDAAGNNIDRHYQLGLTQIDIHAFDCASGTARVSLASEVVREARTQVFTEVVLSDEADGRVIGHGSANWAIINPTPPGFVYTDPGPGPDYVPPMPRLTDVFEAQPVIDGGYVIPELTPRLGLDTMHHGPILVVMEAAALDIVNGLAEHGRVTPATLSCRIVRAARKGPFTIKSMQLSRNRDLISCRSVMLDQGRDNEVVAVMLWQARINLGVAE
jgi:acyl-coenzyme A thioesterase PaaI-like protein